ncbi:MAG: response regulator transcription factor [Ktedonobacterales bacterium]
MQVAIVSAFPAIRSGLAALLRAQPGWSVTGESSPAALAASAAPLAIAETPDVMLFDLDALPPAESFAAWLEHARPRAGAVLLVADRPEPPVRGAESLSRAVRRLLRVAEDAGLALGVLGREATIEEIVAALTAAAGGLVTLDRRIAAALWVAPEPAPPAIERPAGMVEEPLTAREREVLQLLAEGLPNKTIAARLHVSEHTIKFHVSSIMLKLNAASRTEAVTQAARRGVLLL